MQHVVGYTDNHLMTAATKVILGKDFGKQPSRISLIEFPFTNVRIRTVRDILLQKCPDVQNSERKEKYLWHTFRASTRQKICFLSSQCPYKMVQYTTFKTIDQRLRTGTKNIYEIQNST